MKDVTLHVNTVNANTGTLFVTDHDFPNRDMALIVASELFTCFEPKRIRVELKSTSSDDLEMFITVDWKNDDLVECLRDYISRRVNTGILSLMFNDLIS